MIAQQYITSHGYEGSCSARAVRLISFNHGNSDTDLCHSPFMQPPLLQSSVCFTLSAFLPEVPRGSRISCFGSGSNCHVRRVVSYANIIITTAIFFSSSKTRAKNYNKKHGRCDRDTAPFGQNISNCRGSLAGEPNIVGTALVFNVLSLAVRIPTVEVIRLHFHVFSKVGFWVRFTAPIL